MRPVQYFSDEYLQQCKVMTPTQIAQFLEDFRLLQTPKPKSRLISMKVPEPLLNAFKRKCEIAGVKYQTQIKALMQEWLGSK